MKLVNLVGKKYGLLTVLSRAGADGSGKTTWLTSCACGGAALVTGLNLKTGNTKSCGCLKHRTGEANPKYKNVSAGVLKFRKRNDSRFREWRKHILLRCPVCMKCGGESNLHAHHILGSDEYPEFRFDKSNGIALCASCHLEFHKRYGRRKGFSEKDAEEYVASPIAWLVHRRNKNGIEDLEKAKHFIDLLIELERTE